MSIISIAPVVAQGAVLANFEPTKFAKNPVYWPIGISFASGNLWYSQPSITDPGLFLITTTGTPLNSLSLVFPTGNGATAWDGTNLWVGSFGGGTSTVSQEPFLFQVSTANGGAILKSLNLTSIIFPDLGLCGIIDGLAFDTSTGTLWVSPDVGCNFNISNNPNCCGFAYQVDTSGNLLRRVQFPFGVSGMTVVGKNLYVVERFNGVIAKTTLEGEVLASFPIVHVNPRSWVESITFDPTTFSAPAIWAMQPYNPGGHTIAQIVDNSNLVAYSIA
jgi:hypothetical protein